MLSHEDIFMKNFADLLNNMEKTTTEFIKKNKIDYRESKNKLSDALHFRFSYTNGDKSSTKQKILSSISFKHMMNEDKKNTANKIDRTSMYRKEKNLPSTVYKNLFHQVKKFMDEKTNLELDDVFIAIDGVYLNTNMKHNGILETSMSMGFYDVNNCMPYDVHFTGGGKKNNEVICAQEYITEHIAEFKGKTIICDRAYFCLQFFNFLVDNGINFIIRVRNECNLVTGKKTKKGAKNYDEYVKIKGNDTIRIVSNSTNIEKKLTENAKESKNVTFNNEVFIVTNLTAKYTDSDVLNLYSSRWDIEEFFKQLKRNFKFQYFDEHFDEAYKKNIYASLTIILIKQIMVNYYNKYCSESLKSKTITSKKKKKEIVLTYSIDENSLIGGIHADLLDKIFNSKITPLVLNNFLKAYKNIQSNEQNRSFERKSKRPFTKWYVKKYHELYKLKINNITTEINNITLDNDDAIQIKKTFKKLKKEITKKYKEDLKKICSTPLQ